MSLYLFRRVRRADLLSVFEEVQLLFGIEPEKLADGERITDGSGLTIFRSIDLGEPRVQCFFHKAFFKDEINVRHH